jgi:hypothetical protein
MTFLELIINVFSNILCVKNYKLVNGAACSFQVGYDTIKKNTPYIVGLLQERFTNFPKM